MLKEGPVFHIFKKRKVIKRSKLIGKPTLRKIKRPTIIIDTTDRRERYFNPITQNYVLRPTYLAALRKIKKKDEELQQKFDDKNRKENHMVFFKKNSQNLYKIILNKNR